MGNAAAMSRVVVGEVRGLNGPSWRIPRARWSSDPRLGEEVCPTDGGDEEGEHEPIRVIKYDYAGFCGASARCAAVTAAF